MPTKATSGMTFYAIIDFEVANEQPWLQLKCNLA